MGGLADTLSGNVVYGSVRHSIFVGGLNLTDTYNIVVGDVTGFGERRLLTSSLKKYVFYNLLINTIMYLRVT